MKRFGFGVKVNFGFALQIFLLLLLTSLVLRILATLKYESRSLVDSNSYYRVLSQAEIDLYKRMFLIEKAVNTPDEAAALVARAQEQNINFLSDVEIKEVSSQDQQIAALITDIAAARTRLLAAEKRSFQRLNPVVLLFGRFLLRKRSPHLTALWRACRNCENGFKSALLIRARPSLAAIFLCSGLWGGQRLPAQ